jgi:hypothetical protein
MTASKTYVLTVLGENLLLSAELRKALGGQLDRSLNLGFSTTWIVEAEDEEEAKALAVDEAYEAVREALPLPLANNRSNPPKIRVEQAREIVVGEKHAGPHAAFTFFADHKPGEVPGESERRQRPPAKKSLWERVTSLFSR